VIIMNMAKEKNFTSKEIDLLLALAVAPSFTEASVLLRITQSAVSRSVKDLETRLGKELLMRGKSGSRPTPTLLALVPKLRAARKALDSLLERSKAVEDVRGKIRVAGFRSAISVLLPPAVTTFIARNRQVRISLSTVREVLGGVQDVVLSGRADFGVTTMPPRRGLRATHLGRDPYVVVQRKGAHRHTIARRECLILWDEKCSDCVPEILKANRWSPLETMQVDSDSGVIAMVEQGAGFAILPELATEPLSPRIERLPLPVAMRREIWLCGHPEVWNTPTGRAFRQHTVRSVITKLSGNS
jgi:DNA-binding transcriptional LysR family regulator